GVVAGEVAAARNHLLGLGDGAPGHFDLCTDATSVFARAFQADGNAWGGGVVATNPGGRVQAADDHVEIAVVVEIGQGHALRNSDRVEAPGRAEVFKRQIVTVVQRNTGSHAARAFRQAFQPGLGGFPSGGSADFSEHIDVLHVVVGAGGEEQVLPSVEVHVQKCDAPGPVRSGDSGELGNLSECAVAASEMERVA